MNDEKPLRRVLVCQNRTCRKQGAVEVLAAFQKHPISGVMVESSPCLGQCGNGPMVLVLPEEVWYSRVHEDEVPAVIERHLEKGKAIASMLYPKMHRRPQ